MRERLDLGQLCMFRGLKGFGLGSTSNGRKGFAFSSTLDALFVYWILKTKSIPKGFFFALECIHHQCSNGNCRVLMQMFSRPWN
jgi:hypothetical protein